MPDDPAQQFIARWSASGGGELANYQSFLIELCTLLGVEAPDPTVPDEYLTLISSGPLPLEGRVGEGGRVEYTVNSSRFGERPFMQGLYRRGASIGETIQGVKRNDRELLSERAQESHRRRAGHGQRGTRAYDDAMIRARGQAEQYARNLPPEEGRPPLPVVIDVGHSIELYAEFTQTGGVYTAFPDPLTHRIKLADLNKNLKPAGLDPEDVAGVLNVRSHPSR